MTEQTDKKQYEMSFLLQEEGGLSTVTKFVKDLGGEIEVGGPVAKITLSYPIKKEKSAFFGFLHFSMNPSGISQLTHEMETKPEILRHLIITPPFKKMETRPKMETPRAPERVPMERKPEPARAPETLTNEDLEKKIEEILK